MAFAASSSMRYMLLSFTTCSSSAVRRSASRVGRARSWGRRPADREASRSAASVAAGILGTPVAERPPACMASDDMALAWSATSV